MFSLISILSNRVLWEADTIPKNYAAGTKVRSITPRSFNSTGITSTKYDLVMADNCAYSGADCFKWNGYNSVRILNRTTPITRTCSGLDGEHLLSVIENRGIVSLSYGYLYNIRTISVLILVFVLYSRVPYVFIWKGRKGSVL